MAFITFQTKSHSHTLKRLINVDSIAMLSERDDDVSVCTLTLTSGESFEVDEDFFKARERILKADGCSVPYSTGYERRVETRPTGSRADLVRQMPIEGTPIDVLNLTKCQATRLSRKGYNTVERIDAASNLELEKINTFGPKTVAMIRKSVAAYKGQNK